MFIVNRFKIVRGKKDFEAVWRNRETHLDGVDGFHNFVWSGEQAEDHTLYASHSTWETRQHFSIGPSRMPLKAPTKMQVIIHTCTSAILILKVLKSLMASRIAS